jgi:hypothetical protein
VEVGFYADGKANAWCHIDEVSLVRKGDQLASAITEARRPFSQPDYYTLSGRKTNNSQRGLLIVRNTDGTTRKIFMGKQ